MATIRDVAAFANVSVATVSRVLNNAENVNGELKDRVLSAVEQMGYVPNNVARVLARKKTGAIGVVINNLHDPFFHDLIRGFERGGAETNYNVVFCSALGNDAESKERYVSYLSSGVTDGIVLYGSYLSDEKIVKRLIESKSVFVLIENEIEGLETNSLLIDNTDGAETAVDYLVSLGHKEIAHISGNLNRKVSADRLNGYLKAMHKHSLTIEQGYIQHTVTDYKSGYDLMKTVLSQTGKPPTAVFCCDDAIATYAILAAQDMGLSVPRDISVMGFDNQKLFSWGYNGPAITTMEQPLFEIGAYSIRVLTELLSGQREADTKIREIYKTRLVEKDSVRALDQR